MITITFKKNTLNQFIAFEISGHASYDHSGRDIVCAAVSALSITTYNNIEHMAKYSPIVDIEEELGGFLYVEVLPDLTDEQQQLTQILLENLYLGLLAIANEYPNYVQMKQI